MVVRELVTLLGFKVDDGDRVEYDKQIENTKKKGEGLTTAFIKAQAIVGIGQRVIGSAYNYVATQIIGATVATENYQASLGAMIGDQEKANQVILELQNHDLTALYDTNQVIGSLQNMASFGMSTEEATKNLTLLGDVALGNQSTFNNLGMVMSRAYTQGAASASDLNRFTREGVDVTSEIARQTGRSREEVAKAGASYKELTAALTALTGEGGKFANGLERQMNTLGGTIKALQSLREGIGRSIGANISEPLRQLLKMIYQIGTASQESFIGVMSRAINGAIRFLMQLGIVFEVLQYRIEDALEPIGGLEGIIKGLVAFLQPILMGLWSIFTGLFNFIVAGVLETILIFSQFAGVFNVISNVLGAFMDGLGFLIGNLMPGLVPLIIAIVAAVKVWNAVLLIQNVIMAANPAVLIVIAIIAAVALLIGLVRLVIKHWGSMVDWFKNLGKVIVGFFKVMGKGIIKTFEPVLSFIRKFVQIVATIFRTYVNVWMAIFSVLGRFFKSLWDGIVAVAMNLWAMLSAWFKVLIENIKMIWGAIVGWFASLWESMKEAPMAFANFVVKVLTGALDFIKDKFMGFFNFIGDKWNGLKGLMGGAWESVVNFATGGSNNEQQLATQLAGATQSAGGGVQDNSTNVGNVAVSVSVPQGTPEEQAKAIAQQANSQVLTSIQQARGNIANVEAY